jgi:RNA polymerase-binding transcription factor DksA
MFKMKFCHACSGMETDGAGNYLDTSEEQMAIENEYLEAIEDTDEAMKMGDLGKCSRCGAEWLKSHPNGTLVRKDKRI